MLRNIPLELWGKVVPAERAILLSMASRIMRAEMEKLCEIAATVILKKSFSHVQNDALYSQMLQRMLRTLQSMTTWSRIQTLILRHTATNGVVPSWTGHLAEVLGQCAWLAHLDLSGNGIRVHYQ